jgi:hypothetical protein
MADIGRVGWRKPGLLMPCPGSLVAAAWRQMVARWLWSAPVRCGVRGSFSPWVNRQLRVWPSAVSRARSDAAQKGLVTDPLTPARAGPVGREDLGGRGSPAGWIGGGERELCRQGGQDFAGGDHL